MRQLAEGHAALKELIDVVCFVVRHVLDLKVQIEMRKLRVPGFAVPLARREPAG